MERSGAARRYARAVLDIAIEQGTVDVWRSDVDDVAAVLADSELAEVLADAAVPRERRYALIERVLDIQPMALSYAKLLVNKSRTREAGHIAEEFHHLADVHEGISRAEVVTAVELEQTDLDRIIEQLRASTGRDLRVRSRIDPAIIGGLIVRIEDRIYDGSVRTRLRSLKRHLSGVS